MRVRIGLVPLALVLASALAGCTGDGTPPPPQTFTCPRGEVIELPAEGVAEGTDPQTLCPKAPPAVALTSPATARVYREVSFNWSVASGDYPQGHSMLTSVRVSMRPMADDAILGPDSYGTEVARHEHQNLPAELQGAHTFQTPGTYYVRAYATIMATGLGEADHWSSERTIVVTDVEPTGNSTVVTHPAGNLAGKLDPAEVTLALGDALVFRNEDVVERVFTPDGCAQYTDPVAVSSMASSPPLVFKVPGTCTFQTDDLQPQTLTVNVTG